VLSNQSYLPLHWLDLKHIFFTVIGYPLSYIEFVGVVAGLACVWLAARANILTWPVGLLNIACFFAIFYQIRLYSDMFLQVYFFIASLYGWWNWSRPGAQTRQKVMVVPDRQRLWLAAVIVLATLLIGTAVSRLHEFFPAAFPQPASYPYVDTFVAVMSVVATVLLARRKLENWALWVLVNLISVALYAKKNVLFIALEYAVLLLIAAYGLITWYKLWKQAEQRNPVPAKGA
jgi:nicotinamide mononucleotide transporter